MPTTTELKFRPRRPLPTTATQPQTLVSDAPTQNMKGAEVRASCLASDESLAFHSRFPCCLSDAAARYRPRPCKVVKAWSANGVHWNPLPARSHVGQEPEQDRYQQIHRHPVRAKFSSKLTALPTLRPTGKTINIREYLSPPHD